MDRILLAHGSGGKLAHELIERVFVPVFDDPILAGMEDSATVDFSGRLAFTTDSFVVSPLVFPGGDIGKVAVCGTVNDLAMAGARPLYLSVGMIIEEGLELEVLQSIVRSMKATADEAGVRIVTGDTKVVNRGCADRLFINTSGIGLVRPGLSLSAQSAQAGDLILINGGIGEHGVAVMGLREGLAFSSSLVSDCAPLAGLVQEILEVCPRIRVLRDPTRGGVATTLNELARQSNVGMLLQEEALPIKPEVAGACEMLGLEPLHVANEGKVLAIVPREDGARVLEVMRSHRYGGDAAVIGEVRAEKPGRLVMKTLMGTNRMVDMLTGDLLPRIC